MDFSEEELNEFRVEAREMLDSAEEQLLSIEKGESPLKFYDGIFRVMHSLKGGAGMLGLSALQSHMHTLESLFSTFKGAPAIPAENTSLFLKAIDVARLILNGKQVAFQFEKSNTTPIANPNPTSIPQKPEVRNQAKEKHKHGAESALIYSIDDEQDILDIVKEEVELAGHQCKTFTEAEALFAEIKKNAPDVVLSDMKMPKITGHEVIKEVSLIDPDLPVILLSGFLDKEALLKAMANGAFSAIEKPFNEKSLLGPLNNAFRHRKAMKALNKSINLLLYQFSDLDSFLKGAGKDDIRNTLKTGLDSLIKSRRELRLRSK